MASDMIRFTLWFTALSLVVTYAWWVKVRVLRLRQDLFYLRDDMFDAVSAVGGLEAQAYIHQRNKLNGLLRMAGTLSPMTMFYLAGIKVPVDEPVICDPAVKAIVDRTHDLVIKRLVRFMFRENLTGRALSALMWALPKGVKEREVNAGVDRGLRPVERMDNSFRKQAVASGV